MKTTTAPPRFSPDLRAAIKDALASPSQATVFSAEEIVAIFESDRRPVTLAASVWCVCLGGIVWGAIGFAAGVMVGGY